MKKLIYSVEECYLSSGSNLYLSLLFAKKYYITMLINIGMALHETGKEEEALRYTDTGIQAVFKMDLGRSLSSLYDSKARILYSMDHFIEAEKYFQSAITIYEDQGLQGYVIQLKKLIQEDYPMIEWR